MTPAVVRIVIAASSAGFLLALLALVEYRRTWCRYQAWRRRKARKGYIA